MEQPKTIEDMAKASYWQECNDDGHPWSSTRDAYEDAYSEGYKQGFTDRGAGVIRS